MTVTLYLLNISPTKASMNMSLDEAWSSRKTDISHLKVFRCVTYDLINECGKMDKKSDKYIFTIYINE